MFATTKTQHMKPIIAFFCLLYRLIFEAEQFSKRIKTFGDDVFVNGRLETYYTEPESKFKTVYPTGPVPRDWIQHQQYISNLIKLEHSAQMDEAKRKRKSVQQYYLDVALSQVVTVADYSQLKFAK
jgi:hypothetical protein